jgi:hypothetical protein
LALINSNDSLIYGTMKSPWINSRGQSIISQRVRERSKFKGYSEPVPFEVSPLSPSRAVILISVAKNGFFIVWGYEQVSGRDCRRSVGLSSGAEETAAGKPGQK